MPTDQNEPSDTGDDRFRQPPASTVGALARRSAKWAFLTVVLRQCVLLGSTMIVSRLLTPADTGVAAMALTVMSFVVLLDTALTWATIQPRELTKTSIDGMFWLSIFVGTTLLVICTASAPVVSIFFSTPDLKSVMPVLGLAAFCNSLATQPAALMKRQLRQKRSNLIDSLAVFGGAAASVIVALIGWGHWALILQFVSMHAVRAILFWKFAGYTPGRFSFGIGSQKMAFKGLALATSNYICYFQLYLGSILVGRVFGPEVLGYYTKANAVKGMPTQYATMVVTDVMVASLAAMKAEPLRMAVAYRKALALTAMLGCPAGAFLYICAAEIVFILYGPNWTHAVPMLRIFSIAAVALPITTTTIWLFLATGNARAQLALNIILTPLVVAAFLVAAATHQTAHTFVFVEAILSTTLLMGANIVVSHRSAEIRILPTAIIVAQIVIAAGVALSVTYLALGMNDKINNYSSAFGSVIARGSVFGAIYCVMIAPLLAVNVPTTGLMIQRLRNSTYDLLRQFLSSKRHL